MTNPLNLLADQTSPYLLQHADNPVNWHPWNEQALQLAKKENKPILLSIGYSACHWCHVMAHESFEDTATASVMNEHFINIKVDREERPDLDKIYQTAHSLLTSRSGGWPLTVFLSPQDHMPFFAGTYFPDKRRHNMPSFTEIMHMVADAYNNKKSEIDEQSHSIQGVLKKISSHISHQDSLTTLPLDLARKQLEGAFDKQHGGFGSAPKFPHADMIERCLRHYLFLKSRNKQDSTALEIATYTLNKMSLGGFQDHIGGGFYRYSTDDYWMIPHFEKMLYDNAQLFALFSQAYAITRKPLYQNTIINAAEWIIREMQTPEGGYCSALDADTDKIEGKTYVWEPQEIKSLLNEDEFTVCSLKYGLSKDANFEGKWHLHSTIDNHEVAATCNRHVKEIEQHLASIKLKLLNARNKRTQPGRDDKILCAWNALMIRGMSLAGRHCNRSDFIESAIQSANFIFDTLWVNKRLLASYKDGKAHLNAYLDDYAYLLRALLDLLQSSWSVKLYNWAIEIADSLLENFEDTEQGGFFFTSHDHEQLLYRSKTFSDDAMPNGNAVAAYALQQLGLLTGNTRYLDAAERTIRCGYDELSEQAISHCSLLHALEIYLSPAPLIILRGNSDKLNTWQTLTLQYDSPSLFYIAIDNTDEMPAALADKKPIGDICAYICEGTHCLPPVTQIGEYEKYLSGKNNHDDS